jgi:hypothetical protein
MDTRPDDPDARQHAIAIEYTLKELQKNVAEHERKLEKVWPMIQTSNTVDQGLHVYIDSICKRGTSAVKHSSDQASHSGLRR